MIGLVAAIGLVVVVGINGLFGLSDELQRLPNALSGVLLISG